MGDRWTLLVVAALLEGASGSTSCRIELEGIAPNVLSARLKLLTEQALLVARPYSERPPRFEYELTEAGRELAGALRLLADWGARGEGRPGPLRHDVCGTALEARWWCPTCDASWTTTPTATTSSTSVLLLLALILPGGHSVTIR